jgi:predicted nucleic acid-binding protein
LTAFADTSFLGSLYLPDSNSRNAVALASASSTPVLLSALGELELINAVQLYGFRKQASASELLGMLASFRGDLESGVVAIRPMSDAMYEAARQLSSQWTASLGMRSLDILQVSAAIVLRSDTFLTFDVRQKRLAQAAGLVCP